MSYRHFIIANILILNFPKFEKLEIINDKITITYFRQAMSETYGLELGGTIPNFKKPSGRALVSLLRA